MSAPVSPISSEFSFNTSSSDTPMNSPVRLPTPPPSPTHLSNIDACSICSLVWDQDEHRLCSLPCGHMFGSSCIGGWFLTNNPEGNPAKCPLCVESFTMEGIRYLYAVRSITVADDKLHKDIWDLQAKMAKIYETTRHHAKLIEDLTAKEVEQASTITKQMEIIRNQTEAFNKLADLLSSSLRTKKPLEPAEDNAAEAFQQMESLSLRPQKGLAKAQVVMDQYQQTGPSNQSSQQAFSQLPQPGLMPQKNIQGARRELYPRFRDDPPYRTPHGSEEEQGVCDAYADKGGSTQNLASLYPPPCALMFNGSFEKDLFQFLDVNHHNASLSSPPKIQENTNIEGDEDMKLARASSMEDNGEEAVNDSGELVQPSIKPL